MFRYLIILLLLTAAWPQEPPALYRNTQFQFSYKIPYGWVDRTAQMREDSATGNLLLAAFERPPEAAGETINAAVIIAAEAAATYPGLKTASDYFAPLTELTTSKGFKVKNDPYEFSVDARQLPRADYTKPLGQLTMYQSSLVLLSKGQVVSFTFIAGSEDELTQQIENLKFLTPAKGRPPKSE